MSELNNNERKLVVSTLHGVFPVSHLKSIKLQDPNNHHTLKYYAETFVSKLDLNCNCHTSNWKHIKYNDLHLVLFELQCLGAPPLTDSVAANTIFKCVTPTNKGDGRYTPGNVIILPSSIPGAGMGAFASRPIRKGHLLGTYEGTTLTSEKQMNHEANDLDNPYVFEVRDPDEKGCPFVKAIDASSLWSVKGKARQGGWTRYINDAEQPCNANTEYTVFIPETKRAKDYRIELRSTTNIRKGEELLALYVNT